ncbi:MAG: hypothetical protein WAV22_05195 [Porticoccaceae bacterium]
MGYRRPAAKGADNRHESARHQRAGIIDQQRSTALTQFKPAATILAITGAFETICAGTVLTCLFHYPDGIILQFDERFG